MSINEPNSRLRKIAEITKDILSSRYMLLWAILLGAALVLPSIKAGLIADDYHHKILMTGGDERVRAMDSPLS